VPTLKCRKPYTVMILVWVDVTIGVVVSVKVDVNGAAWAVTVVMATVLIAVLVATVLVRTTAGATLVQVFWGTGYLLEQNVWAGA
jgi:hypothetical protein